MIIVPFESQHLEQINLQDSQAYFGSMIEPDWGPSLMQAGPCFSAIHDGAVLASSGVIKHWENRATAWALLSKDATPHFVRIHRAVSRFLDLTDFKRVEAFVDADFEEGHRWIQMLGFEREGYMRSFSPNGNDAILYARIK